LPDAPKLRLPARRDDALDATALLHRTEGMTGGEREQFFRNQYLEGNIPSHLRTLHPLELGGGRVVVFVTHDYLALGSDADAVRVPLARNAAWTVARAANATLPTPHIVDEIYRASPCRVTSVRFGVMNEMATSSLYLAHSKDIDEHLAKGACERGGLVAGPKKDLVLSARENGRAGRLAIYGWFRTDGSVIQPLSLVHSDQYVDYTHGIRLVSNDIRVDGTPMTFKAALRDRAIGKSLSDEGAFTASYGTIDEH
jgi:hypothetical protein